MNLVRIKILPFRHHSADPISKGTSDILIRIKKKDPVPTNLLYTKIPLISKTRLFSLIHVFGKGLRDLYRMVSTVAIDHNKFLRPINRCQTAVELPFFIVGNHDD